MLIALKWLKIEVRDLDGRKQIILVTASLKKRIVLVCFSVLKDSEVVPFSNSFGCE